MPGAVLPTIGVSRLSCSKDSVQDTGILAERLRLCGYRREAIEVSFGVGTSFSS